MTPEGKVKQQIKKILDAYDVYYFMPHGGMFGNIGVPDFVACYHGWFLAIEAKAKGNKPSPRQEKHLQAINNHGGRGLVIDENNLDSLTKLLKLI